MKALVGAFNQEKALVGAFSVITNLWMELFQALTLTFPVYQTAPTGRTWLGVHQARGASNVSEGFAI